jgi:hypothetical protein
MTGGTGGGGRGGNAGASAAGGAGNGGGGASGSAGKAGGNGGGAAGMAGMGGGASGSAGKGGSGGGGPIVELAGSKTASADSEENNTTSNPPKVNLASSGNDGLSSTRWCAANAGQHYWQVDLGATHELVRVEIDFEYPAQASGYAYGYTVGTSGDGATFTTAIDQRANTGTTMMQMAQFPAATTGRYVRITVIPPTTNPATWSSFWEARVYGR